MKKCESYIKIRVPNTLKTEFIRLCESKGRTMSSVLREIMFMEIIKDLKDKKGEAT